MNELIKNLRVNKNIAGMGVGFESEAKLMSQAADEIEHLSAQVEQLRTSNGKKFTAALNVIDTDYHITLCFADCVKAGKVSTSPQTGDATVIDVVYWDHCDLTVALVSSDFCNERAEYWAENGYAYTLGYKPHFTLGKGDCTSIYKCMVGKTYQVGGEYCRVFDVGVKTTPDQCLAARDAEIRAQAVEDAIEATASNKYSLPLRDACDLYEYANQIRQQGEQK